MASEAERRFGERFGDALALAVQESPWLGRARGGLLAHGEAWVRLAWLVVERNALAGLTRIVEPEEMAVKHFIDSLAPLVFGLWPPGTAVVDVGSGAGFPGIVLGTVLPGIKLTLVEASRRKAEFLRYAAQEVGIEADVRHVRAEDFGRAVGGEGREAYDIGLARAAAPLAVSCELVLPLLRVGGRYLAQLGPADGAALQARAASPPPPKPLAWETLGARLAGLKRTDLPEAHGTRYVANFLKHRTTPPAYPRRAGTPERQPLLGVRA